MNKNDEQKCTAYSSTFIFCGRLPTLEGDDKRVKVPSHYVQYLFLSPFDSDKNASLFVFSAYDGRARRAREETFDGRLPYYHHRASSPHRVSRYSSLSRSYRRRTKFGTAAKASDTFVESAKKALSNTRHRSPFFSSAAQ